MNSDLSMPPNRKMEEIRGRSIGMRLQVPRLASHLKSRQSLDSQPKTLLSDSRSRSRVLSRQASSPRISTSASRHQKQFRSKSPFKMYRSSSVFSGPHSKNDISWRPQSQHISQQGIHLKKVSESLYQKSRVKVIGRFRPFNGEEQRIIELMPRSREVVKFD